jgi:NitT/TauT family transport system substrate-binding protein
MGCCDEFHAAPVPPGLTSANLTPPDVSRRNVLKGVAAVAGVLGAVAPAPAQQKELKKLKLAFCSQILCIIPYEVARANGHWKNHGLEVELVYTRGGNAAMQALVGGAVDYAATALDVAIQAYAKGAPIRRFATTGRLPLFALVTAPKNAATIRSVKDLEGKTVAVSGLGQADHALLLFLLKQVGADKDKVQFATLGVNILEALRQGQVDAGLVQEPALTILTRGGARTLVNAMDLADAQKYLGGPYEFMGVSVRAGEIDARRAEMLQIARGLDDALKAIPRMKPEDMVAALPKELLAGANVADLSDVLRKYATSLYPDKVAIDLSSSRRVADTLRIAGLVKADADVSGLHDTTIVVGG